MIEINYNPDVLSCLANLSNDEVFTPPGLANQILDQLPVELWSDKNATFLDPVCKSGVFLREIAKRLVVGLEGDFPDVQERVNHIFSKQLFGIAITELTALLSRRSVYCSKNADGDYSVCTDFDAADGNIIFNRIEHTWEDDRCIFCRASKQLYDRGGDLETYSYEFIHTKKPNRIFDMKFDVIVGNPPYQLNVGVEKENYAVPLYHSFVAQAKKLNPRFLAMIIPSRWFAGGRGLDEFREEMLNDDRLRKIVDFPNATDCFPGVDISGGVCYFLWDRDNRGDCEIKTVKGTQIVSSMTRPLLEKGQSTFIRFNESISIVRKIKKLNEPTFDTLISPQTPFGFLSSFKDYKKTAFKGSVKIHTVNGVGHIPKQSVMKNSQWIGKYKLYISKSYGERGNYPYLFLAKPFVGEKDSCCTQTYLMIGPFASQQESYSARKYIQTKFFRFLIMLKKNTQDAMRGVYAFVPIQDLSQEWTDERLYKKYGLSEEEVEFIESMVRPMELEFDYD